MLRTYLSQNLPDPHGPEPVPSGHISSSRATGYSPSAIEQICFKKGIKREIAAYPSLKDERYFMASRKPFSLLRSPMSALRSWTPPILQVVNLRNKSFLKPWGRPLSEDTWPTLILNQFGKSSVNT